MPEFRPYSPPQRPDPSFLLVGESLGLVEEMSGRPFVGQSGNQLRRLLAEAGINLDECYQTNVFQRRPKENKIENLCGKKADVGGAAYKLPPLSPGKYILPGYLGDVKALQEFIDEIKPDLTIALGNTACWALIGKSGIAKHRGVITEHRGHRILPTYHPAAVMRQWDLHNVVIADFMKAKENAKRNQTLTRTICIPESVEDICSCLPKLSGCDVLSFDIETKARQITCIGFAPSPDWAISIPIWSTESLQSVWSEDEESRVWELIAEILASDVPKLAQNGLYDLQYLWRMGIPVNNYSEDTMLLHHTLQPELQKGLGFLGSVYANEGAWKLLPKSHSTLKADQ
jgi:DNA polymerase